MSTTIIFIHGMFLNGKSWEKWVSYFERRGYGCVAPDWPLHEGEPVDLRANIPPGAGELGLDAVVEAFARRAEAEERAPIFIGHSVGGLIAQKLVARGLGAAAVCISSVAPNAMLSLDWDFFKNTAKIANPAKGDEPFPMTEEAFHASFANTMAHDESARAHHRYVVHESRNVLRDAMGDAGRIDLDRPHVPLLFIGAEEDRVIPDKLGKKIAEAYTDRTSIAAFIDFPGRGHFICGEPRWEEVATFAADWLQRHVDTAVASTAPRAAALAMQTAAE